MCLGASKSLIFLLLILNKFSKNDIILGRNLLNEEDTLKNEQPVVFNVNNINGKALRIATSATGKTDPNHPVVFTVSTNADVKTWRIPSHSSARPGHEMSLCPHQPTEYIHSHDKEVKIEVSTNSEEEKSFSIKVTEIDNILITEETAVKNVSISSDIQQLFQFDFPKNGTDTDFLIKVNMSSPETPAVCSLVSIQPKSNCQQELYDQESNMRFGTNTMYQTMLELSAMVISKEDFPGEEGVNIVLRSLRDDTVCSSKTDADAPKLKISDRSMTVDIYVERLSENKILGTFLVLLFYFVVGLVAVVGSVICAKKVEFEGKYLRYGTLLEKRLADQVDGGGENEVGSFEILEGTKARRFKWQQKRMETKLELADKVNYDSQFMDIQNQAARASTDAPDGPLRVVKSFVTLDMKKVQEKRADRKNVRVADMAIKHNKDLFPNFIRMRSDMFVWLISVAGIYYTLPVVQLVFYYQETARRSGNMDTCYYNFLCLYPWVGFSDFGHMFSNIGYIVSGVFFMMIVRYRSYKYEKLIKKFDIKTVDGKSQCPDHLHPKNNGIPQTYGIFYAMGGALALEGILSGCYHICPTTENFQFDTTFMYVIIVLVFLKVYQFRHCDITHTAHFIFVAIGAALVLEGIGYFTDHVVFWIFYLISYILFVIYFVIRVYMNGSGSKFEICRDTKTFLNNLTNLCKGNSEDRPHTIKLVGALGVFAVNIVIAIYFGVMNKQGVSRYTLGIMMVNMMLYIVYYISHKIYFRCRSGEMSGATNSTTANKEDEWMPSEGFRKITIIYFLLSVVSMGIAMYFFRAELKKSSDSPAESRNLNDYCALSIFDNHDVWHFCSAAGLFYLFMFILTLEDYNTARQRHLIPVF